jgi:hypothetical protein
VVVPFVGLGVVVEFVGGEVVVEFVGLDVEGEAVAVFVVPVGKDDMFSSVVVDSGIVGSGSGSGDSSVCAETATAPSSRRKSAAVPRYNFVIFARFSF